MPLELRKNRDGTLRPCFYGRYLDKAGKIKIVNLKVPIMGRPPRNLHHPGDKDFEKARQEAEDKLAALMREGKTARNARYWAEKVYELKSGGTLGSTAIQDFTEAAWSAMPHRKHHLAESYQEYMRGILQRFADYMATNHPAIKETAAIRAGHVRGFMQEKENRKLSARTWGQVLGVLKSAFRNLEPHGDAYGGYLMNATGREKETVHREPFTPEEIKAVLEAAAGDDLMRGLITTALCTAMRRGDCALLKWASVDLQGGFLTVKTGKTGETVEIPIMPILRAELEARAGRGGEYVFPEAAAMYQKNPDGLNWRLRDVLEKAGFVDADTAERIKKAKERPPVTVPEYPQAPVEEVRRRGFAWIDGAAMTPGKRDRMRRVFDDYTQGLSMSKISAAMGIVKPTVSGLVREVQAAINLAVVRKQELPPLPETIRGVTQATETDGPRVRRANVKGWHSFRTTFITLALSAGMPMEIVRRVTGHTTVDVVLKHYFRPGREQLRQAVQLAMPRMLTSGQKTRDEQLLEILEGMTPETMEADRERMREIIRPRDAQAQTVVYPPIRSSAGIVRES